MLGKLTCELPVTRAVSHTTIDSCRGLRESTPCDTTANVAVALLAVGHEFEGIHCFGF